MSRRYDLVCVINGTERDVKKVLIKAMEQYPMWPKLLYMTKDRNSYKVVSDVPVSEHTEYWKNLEQELLNKPGTGFTGFDPDKITTKKNMSDTFIELGADVVSVYPEKEIFE